MTTRPQRRTYSGKPGEPFTSKDFTHSDCNPQSINWNDCPWSKEQLSSYEKIFPHLICCPLTDNPFSFVERQYCQYCKVPCSKR